MTPTEIALRAAEKRNEDLEQRLSMLEDTVFERGLSVREFDKAAFSIHKTYGFPRSKTMMLRYLLVEDLVSSSTMIEIIDYNGGHGRTGRPALLMSHIYLLRSACERHGIVIHNARGIGFFLDSPTKQRIRDQCGIETDPHEQRIAA